MPTFGRSIQEYIEFSGKNSSARLSELGIRSPDDVSDITMEVNLQLRDSRIMTNQTVWNILTAGGYSDPSFDVAMKILEDGLEEWKRLNKSA